jgi:hypothetical protein
MTPEHGMEKLDVGLKDEQDAIAKLQGTVAENRKAISDLNNSLEHLEEVARKLEEEHG